MINLEVLISDRTRLAEEFSSKEDEVSEELAIFTEKLLNILMLAMKGLSNDQRSLIHLVRTSGSG